MFGAESKKRIGLGQKMALVVIGPSRTGLRRIGLCRTLFDKTRPRLIFVQIGVLLLLLAIIIPSANDTRRGAAHSSSSNSGATGHQNGSQRE